MKVVRKLALIPKGVVMKNRSYDAEYLLSKRKVKSIITRRPKNGFLRHNRRIELAMEGYYYADIRRWGIAEK